MSEENEVWQQQIKEGQAVYSNFTLRFYDFWVLGFSNYLLWRCPTRLLRQKFSEWASPKHLDIGVGTAYYLAKCLTASEKLAILDLNRSCLDYAANRIRKLRPQVYHCDILSTPLKRQDFGAEGFDSISLNYLLHCLPGNMKQKEQVFANVKPLLNQAGRIFGSTILGLDTPLNRGARRLMALYNRKGIFHNREDRLHDLRLALEKHFTDVKIEICGCVAIFIAQNAG